MNVAPAHCVVVEDSRVGIEAAVAANMHPVLYDPSGDVAHSLVGCDVITHMRELLAHLRLTGNTA